MSTAELKTRLIEKIQSTDDHQVLRAAIRLMDIHLSDTEVPFELTDEMNQAIGEARKQIKNGEYYTHEQAKAEINEWLGE